MSITKHLLPQVPKYFKTNLHTHSTISDGKLTPKKLKEEYIAKGYQVISITDHNITADHSNLCDNDFLALTGVEINTEFVNYQPKYSGPVYHINLISKTPNNLWSPAKAYHQWENCQQYEEKMQFENMDTSCNCQAVNTIIEKANQKGFLVMYNHPTWSCQSYPDYASLKGLWGMEIRNTESCLLGNNDNNNSRVFKDLLNLGNKIYPIGADDTHSNKAIGGSWIMVGAESLNYESVIKALENGDFYMSCGPQIHSLSIKDNILTITCSDAAYINLESHVRFARHIEADKGSTLNEARFNISIFTEKSANDPNAYLHLTVVAPDGSYAATRAYYINELLT